MKLGNLLGVAVVAAIATTDANAAFYGSENFRAPLRGVAGGPVGWVISNGSAGTSGGAAAARAGDVNSMGSLSAGGSLEVSNKIHLGNNPFVDGYTFTADNDMTATISLVDQESGRGTPIYNFGDLKLSVYDSSGNMIAEANESGSVTNASLLAGNEYTVSVSGVAQALRGGSYAFAVKGGPHTVVPVPAAAWLFGSALAMVFGVSRRRKIS